MERDEIENWDAVTEAAMRLATNVANALAKYLEGKDGESIKKCPACGSDFDLIEVGVAEKSLADFWKKHGYSEYTDLQEFIALGALSVLKKAELKSGPEADAVQEQIDFLRTEVSALQKIGVIMKALENDFHRAAEQKDQKGANAAMYNAMMKIFKVFASLNPEKGGPGEEE